MTDQHPNFIQSYFHGTKSKLGIGDLVVPGNDANYGVRKAKFVYASSNLNVAIWGAELAVGDGVGAADVARHFAVGDALHLQRVQPAEVSDLVEGQRGVVHQPDGGRLRHEDLGGHFSGPGNEGARPFGRAGDVVPYRPKRAR